ncbi:MAG: hypothetical protein MK135_08695, partial [Polyangiaceae bacterium]|nr:hypothetical protein [Polyangiaceae bacterium]
MISYLMGIDIFADFEPPFPLLSIELSRHFVAFESSSDASGAEGELAQLEQLIGQPIDGRLT